MFRGVDESPFRAPGKASSPTLELLAKRARESKDALIREASALAPGDRQKRLERAVGVEGLDASWWGMAALVSGALGFHTCAIASVNENAFVMMLSFPIPILLSAIWLSRREKRKREREAQVAEALAWAEAQPFPVTGYADWLASEVPLLDVVFAAPLDRRFADAVHAVDAAIEVNLLDDRTARLAIPPRVLERGEAKHRVGDREALARLTDQLLRPLHSEVGLVRVDMGGSMLRR